MMIRGLVSRGSDFVLVNVICVFFFKQKTAYEMRISDWSSDVCSSDLPNLSTKRIPSYRGPESAYGSDTQYCLDRLSFNSINGAEIGRASCRERVCQYV